uniref:Uncharacterized protein n=1 Tax=Wuchereria bancrofti TaxID=6293 RepID=A0A1I8EIT0_WUCBA
MTSIRASFNREILRSDNFVDSADRYLSALKNCFDITQESIQFSDFKPALIDEKSGRVFGNGINRFIDSVDLELYVIEKSLFY